MERSNGSTCKFKNKKQETEKSKNFPPRGNRLNSFIYYESPYLRLQYRGLGVEDQGMVLFYAAWR